MGFFNAMSQWFMYFLPAIVALVRTRMGKSIPIPTWQLFLFNLTLAWTVVGWILAMIFAWGYNPVPWMAFTFLKLFPGAGSTTGGRQAGTASPSGGQGHLCSTCGGAGTVSCSQCGGRGTWYTQPTSANDVAQLEGCSYCMRSGRIRCLNCGGAGHVI